MNINITTNKYGYFNLSTVYNNQYYHKSYLYYTLEDAMELFKEYVFAEDKKIFYNVGVK